MIERKIIIGIITSTPYLKKIHSLLDLQLFESSLAKLMARWVLEYFEEYRKAPNKDIESIFLKQVKSGMDKELSEEIEEDILPELSEEYEKEGVDLTYLIRETKQYFKERKLLVLGENIQSLVENGTGEIDARIEQAEDLVQDFKTINDDEDTSVDLSNPEVLEKIKKAFTTSIEPLLKFPKQLGDFWNDSFVAGGFVAFLAREKMGKTFLVLECGMTAAKNNIPVAFFQAGDMNEDEQFKRIGIHLNKTSNLEKYCQEHYQAKRDCVHNQTNTCDREERECSFGIFDGVSVKQVREGMSQEDLIEAYNDNPDYEPCYNCPLYRTQNWGVPWIDKIEKKSPITYKQAIEKVEAFFIKNKRNFRLSTHANGTLSINKIVNLLDKWEEEDGFIPKIILIDYMDILQPRSSHLQPRDQQNELWKDARRLSQTPRGGSLPLVIAPTQSDADSYTSDLLLMKNFSEDKRKYGHCTAMYGLNQDHKGREKKLGLMRINAIVLREDEYDPYKPITVLQNLRRGRPFLGSFW